FQLALHVGVGIGAEVFSHPAAMAAMMIASTLNFSKFHDAVIYGELRDQAWDTSDKTGWQGDWALGEQYDNQRMISIFGGLPVISLFAGAMSYDGGSSKIAQEILDDYMSREGSDGTEKTAVLNFWQDGFDSRRAMAHQGYVESIQKLTASTEAK